MFVNKYLRYTKSAKKRIRLIPPQFRFLAGRYVHKAENSTFTLKLFRYKLIGINGHQRSLDFAVFFRWSSTF